MMNQACAQCNKKLTDDESITRIVDKYLYLFCCYKCRFQWVVKHFRPWNWTDQLIPNRTDQAVLISSVITKQAWPKQERRGRRTQCSKSFFLKISPWLVGCWYWGSLCS